jgi:hypothetical protein
LARVSSSAVTGSRANDSVTASNAERALSTSCPGASCAPANSAAGSASSQPNANVLAAS